MLNSGFLISIEGIDGSGKSTLAKNVAQLLQKTGLPVLLTKQPGGTPLGLTLREILHTQKDLVCDKSEFLLFAADRAQHFASVVLPALAQGNIVISDRMHDSSLAYQGFGRGLDHNIISVINRWAMNDRMPDLTIYVAIDVETARARLQSSRNELTSFEQEKIDFWQRVQQGFKTIFAQQNNVATLDGSLDQETLTKQAYSEIEKRLRV